MALIRHGDMQDKPIPYALRSTYIEDLAKDKDAPVGIQIQYAELIRQENPAESERLLEEIIERNPSHQGAVLIARLSRALSTGDYRDVKQIAERIRSINCAKPYWVNRLLSVFERQRLELNGLELIFDDQMLSPRILRVLCTGGYEHLEVGILKRKVHKDDRILELGGGIGYLGLTVKKMFPDISYVSFEANPYLVEMTQRNQELNNCRYLVKNQIVGVGGRERPFFIDIDFWVSSLASTRNTVETVHVEEISVQDALGINTPNFLIMDIEGGETELVPIIDFSGIDKFLLELHPGAISDKEYTDILRVIMERGLIMDGKESKENLFYFYKHE